MVELAGREEELRRLLEAAADLERGGARLAVVSGPAGAGKTALADELLLAAPGLPVLAAVGDGLPLGAVEQWLGEGERQPADCVEAGRRLVARVRALQPAILLLDDAHAADEATLQALLFALHRLERDAVLVLVLVREEEERRLPEGLQKAARRASALWLRLGPLTDVDLARMAAATGVTLSAREAQRLCARTGGLPLYAGALLAELPPERWGSDVPPSLCALVAAQLAALEPDARTLIEAVAVLGETVPLREAFALAAVARPFDALQAADLLRADDVSVAFAQPLLRDAVLVALGAGRRARLHASAADVARDPGTALLHRAQAAPGADADLAAQLGDAAGRAARRGGWERVAAFSVRAAALSADASERDRLRLDAIHAMTLDGETAGARAVAADLESAETGPRHGLVLAQLALVGPDLTTAGPLLAGAWEAVDRDADRPLAAEIALVSAISAYFRLRGGAQVAWAREAVALSRRGEPINAFAINLLAGGLAVTGRAEDALALLDDELALAPVEQRDSLPLKGFRGWIRMLCDDLPGARADLAAAAAGARRSGAASTAGVALARLSLAESLAGRWDDAVADAERALAIGIDADDHGILGVARWAAAQVPAARGDWAQAERHARAAAAEAGTSELRIVTAALAAAQIAVARDDPGRVLEALAPILAIGPRDALDEPGPWPWQHLYADALVTLERFDEAHAFLDLHQPVAAARGRRLPSIRLSRVRARLDARDGEGERAGEALRRASAQLGELGMPYERALTELLHGRLLRRHGHRRTAARQLLAARATLAELGARPALERCEQELSACGLLSSRRESGELTTQERSVAQLIVDGYSNREIAAALVVSVKTVEAHITRLYAKLDIRSRTQLKARARSGELELTLTPQP